MTHLDKDAALQQASVPALLMCLAQITGDRRWLDDPFRPKRDISIFADPSGGLAPEVQATVRRVMSSVLDDLHSGRLQLPPQPSEAEIVEMMNVCLGEHVAPEYAGMAMEEMGFASRAVGPVGRVVAEKDLTVLVIGAGFTGICAGRQLLELEVPFAIVERNADIGGIWLDNDYPEAGVDTPNHFYSYSFAPNFDWSSNYSKRREVLDYQRKVFEESGLRPHTQFGVDVVAMHWDDTQSLWEVTTRDRSGTICKRRARVVVTAAGNLNQPKMPRVRGLDKFGGEVWHSARWRHDVALAGRDVAVVGTGASAMQFLRSVAQEARTVTIYQRSPQWARPPQDYHGTTTPESRWLLKNVPFYYAWYRFGLVWRFGDGLLPTVRRDPAWPHPERAMNYRNDRQRVQLTEYLLDQLEGRPDLIAKCLPDYPPYGKRILIDNGWYAALRRDNVELLTDGVKAVEGDQVVTPSGERRRADVIIMATGFEPGKMLGSIDIRGRKGLRLNEVWGDDDPRAYLGMSVPGFPNLYVLSGPNTALAHGGSVLLVSECQVRYVALMLKEMIDKRIRDVEVKARVHDEFNERVDAEHAELVWTHPGMNNWYRNAKGRVFAPMPWRLVDYWQMTRHPRLEDYAVRHHEAVAEVASG